MSFSAVAQQRNTHLWRTLVSTWSGLSPVSLSRSLCLCLVPYNKVREHDWLTLAWWIGGKWGEKLGCLNLMVGAPESRSLIQGPIWKNRDLLVGCCQHPRDMQKRSWNSCLLVTGKPKRPSFVTISIGIPPMPEKSSLLPEEVSGCLMWAVIEVGPSVASKEAGTGSSADWWCFHGQVGVVDRLCCFFQVSSNPVGIRNGLHTMEGKIGSTRTYRKSTIGLEIQDFTSFHASLPCFEVLLWWYIRWVHLDLAIIFGPTSTMLKLNKSKKSARTKVNEFLDGFLDYQMSLCLRPRTGGWEQDLAVHVKNNNFSFLFHCATWVKLYILHSACLGIPTSTLYGLCLVCGVRVKRLSYCFWQANAYLSKEV